MLYIYKIIGDNIRKHRQKLELTQENLADMSNISINFLGQIERATKKASMETIYKIATALKIPVAEIFAETDNQLEIKEDSSFNSHILTNKFSYILKTKAFTDDLRKVILKHLK